MQVADEDTISVEYFSNFDIISSGLGSGKNLPIYWSVLETLVASERKLSPSVNLQFLYKKSVYRSDP